MEGSSPAGSWSAEARPRVRRGRGMDREALETILQVEWGGTTKPSPLRKLPLLSKLVHWNELDADARLLVVEILAEFVASHQFDPDVTWVIVQIRTKLRAAYGYSSGATPVLLRAL